jgi:ankyrin repeat protein
VYPSPQNRDCTKEQAKNESGRWNSAVKLKKNGILPHKVFTWFTDCCSSLVPVIDPIHDIIDSISSLRLFSYSNNGECGRCTTFGSFEGSCRRSEILIEEEGAAVNVTNRNGQTPLSVATANAKLDTMQYLLQHGADTNIAANNGTTPLFVAAEKAHLEIR